MQSVAGKPFMLSVASKPFMLRVVMLNGQLKCEFSLHIF